MSGWQQCERCLSVMRSSDFSAHDCASQEVAQPSWKTGLQRAPLQPNVQPVKVHQTNHVPIADVPAASDSYIAETDSEAEDAVTATDGGEVICIDSDDDDFVDPKGTMPCAVRTSTKDSSAFICTNQPAECNASAQIKSKPCWKPALASSSVNAAASCTNQQKLSVLNLNTHSPHNTQQYGDQFRNECQQLPVQKQPEVSHQQRTTSDSQSQWRHHTAPAPPVRSLDKPYQTASGKDYIDYNNQFKRTAPSQQDAAVTGVHSYNSKHSQPSQRARLQEVHPNANQAVEPKGSTDFIDYGNQFKRNSNAASKSTAPAASWTAPDAKRAKADTGAGVAKGHWEEIGGQNIYITANGKKHSGQLAYIKYKSDRGLLTKKSTNKPAPKKKAAQPKRSRLKSE